MLVLVQSNGLRLSLRLQQFASALDVPALGGAQVHVWSLRLPAVGTDECDRLLRRLRPQLTLPEQARCDKFLVKPARVQFVVARVALRQLVGHYCATNAAELVFDKAERGKPSVRGHELQFNVSHSGRHALIAVARTLRLGVDVEQVWDDKDPFALADRFFSPTEIAALRALAEPQRKAAFFWIWTRKEAYIKARGDGLYMALDSFDVTCGAHQNPQLLASRDHPGDVERWCMFNIDITAEYPATLMVQRLSRTADVSDRTNYPELRCFELAPELL